MSLDRHDERLLDAERCSCGHALDTHDFVETRLACGSCGCADYEDLGLKILLARDAREERLDDADERMVLTLALLVSLAVIAAVVFCIYMGGAR